MKLLYNKWFMAALFIPFLKPAQYVTGASGDMILDIYKIIACIIITTLYLYQRKVSVIIMMVTFFQFCILFSTFVNNGNYWMQSVHSYSVIALCLLTELFLCACPLAALQGIYYYGGLLSIITAITMFLCYPKGMNQGIYMDILGDVNFYFLGHDNASFFLLYPVVICSILLSYLKNQKISIAIWIFSIVIGSAYIYVHSATALVGFFALWVFMIILPKLNGILFNFKSYMAITISFFLLVVIFRMQSLFAFIIEEILHKNLTLTGRTFIWDTAISYIGQSPIFGYGVENLSITMAKFKINHVHNIFLDIIYQGGLVAAILYIGILIACGYKLMHHKEHPISIIVSTSLFIFLMVGMMDYYNSKYLSFLLFIFAYHIDKIIAQQKAYHEARAAAPAPLSATKSRYIKVRGKHQRIYSHSRYIKT